MPPSAENGDGFEPALIARFPVISSGNDLLTLGRLIHCSARRRSSSNARTAISS